MRAGCDNLVDLLTARAAETPDGSAYLFLGDDGAVADERTWGELDRRARALAVRLAGMEGERALLLLPAGLEFVDCFLGCLAAGVVAVPAYPPTSRRSLGRLARLLDDCRPRVVLTHRSLLDRLRRWGGAAADETEWVLIEEIDPAQADAWRRPAIGPRTLAFLQYTSGSTSNPKGVMVRHDSLWHNQEVIRGACGHGPETVFVSWLPLYHDLGLIGNVLQNLYVGSRCALMAPVSFLQRPAAWLEAVSRFGATTSGGPNFAYELCLRRIGEEDRAKLDLSSWTVAFNGAEPVQAQTLRRFAAGFAVAGFDSAALYPCYGLAEATLMVSGGRARFGAFDAAALQSHEARAAEAGEPGGRELAASGRPLPGHRLVVVEPETARLCAVGRVGEVWVGGASVAAGYWRQPEATATTFAAQLADGRGPFLRTGDLGFLDEAGDLFLTGRLKDLIIVRGRNHYPHDLELTAEASHPDLRSGAGAAFTVDVDGEERLVLVHELERHHAAEPAAVAEAVRRAVAEEHELAIHDIVLIRTGSLPKTTSGKVRRRACRQLYLEGGLTAVVYSGVAAAPADDGTADEPMADPLALPPAERPAAIERLLLAWIAEALRVAPGRLAVDRPLTAFGLDSLAAVELQVRLQERLGVAPGFAELLGGATAREIAAALAPEIPASAAAGIEAEAVDGREVDLLLSLNQQPLWFLHQLQPESPAFNVSVAVRPERPVRPEAVEAAVAALVARHPALRTRFRVVDGEPRQRILPALEARVVVDRVEASGWSAERLADELALAANRPLDLEQGAVAAALFADDRGGVLLLTIHHVVVDGHSLWRLLDELAVLLAAAAEGRVAELPPLRGSLPAHMRWQQRLLAGPDGERLEEFWRRRIGDADPSLELIGDRPRAAWRGPAGGSEWLTVPPRLTATLRDLARERGSTLGCVLLAAFQALLHRWSGRDDLVVGAALAARNVADSADLVGCLFNLLPARSRLEPAASFASFLADVHAGMLAALDHQGYPAHLLSRQVPGLSRRRGPLFPVTFLYQSAPGASLAADGERTWRFTGSGGAALELIAVARRAARAELELEIVEAEDRLAACFHFDRELFAPETIREMAACLVRLLQAVAEEPDRPLVEMELVAASEVVRRATAGGGVPGAWAREPTPLAQFAERVERAPEAVAAVHRGAAMTYRELDERSNSLANLIRRLQA